MFMHMSSVYVRELNYFLRLCMHGCIRYYRIYFTFYRLILEHFMNAVFRLINNNN